MFIFSHKTATPISTYTDSYRIPRRTKESYTEPSPCAWLPPPPSPWGGLTVPRVEHPVDQAHLEKMVKQAEQEYSYRNSIEPTAYRPYKYWVTREEERFNPVFIGDDRYATWRTGPYNSAAWNRYTTYLPRIPREAGMETILRGMPMQYPPKPERLNNYEREVVVNMLNSLSRKQLPSLQHRYLVPGRVPYQGYHSPCTGRHYCLRGMDYYVDGAPSSERQISQLVERIVRFGGPLLPPATALAQCQQHPAISLPPPQHQPALHPPDTGLFRASSFSWSLDRGDCASVRRRKRAFA
uniref:Chromosome 9 open reading frame 24 n=1 Tax=Varanus komodoensis TaxID=61221 RepID=A0A8D2LMR0_VARKO